MADQYGKAVSLGVMSKAYGLAESRVGWTASQGPGARLDKLVRFKHYMSICDSGPSGSSRKLTLKHGDELLERNRSELSERISKRPATPSLPDIRRYSR